MSIEKIVDPSQECLKSFIIYSRSIQQTYKIISNLIHRGVLQTSLIVIQTWITNSKTVMSIFALVIFSYKKLDENKQEYSNGALDLEFPDILC